MSGRRALTFAAMLLTMGAGGASAQPPAVPAEVPVTALPRIPLPAVAPVVSQTPVAVAPVQPSLPVQAQVPVRADAPGITQPAVAVPVQPSPRVRPQVAAPAETPSRAQVVTTRKSDPRALTQGFSVVLVLADLQATTAQDDVPPAARRALADMKDFLPYKSYKLLDAAWILGQGANVITRLRGVDEQEYELRLQASPVMNPRERGAGAPAIDQSRAFVRFTLNDAGDESVLHQLVDPGNHTREMAQAVEQEATIERKIQELREKAAETRDDNQQKQIKELEAQIAQLRRQLAQRRTPRPMAARMAGRAVMDTSFTMDIGETVVVGTSRLRGGGKALIALLTAVPARGSRPDAR